MLQLMPNALMIGQVLEQVYIPAMYAQEYEMMLRGVLIQEADDQPWDVKDIC